MNSKSVFIHRIDRSDRIYFVNEAWVNFADSNEAQGLGDRVIGTPIWEYLDGAEVKSIYREILLDLRRNLWNRPLTIPFRCDSPVVRRELRMEIRPLENGAVEFRSILEEETPRSRIALIDSHTPRSAHSIKLCAWCRSVRHGDRWITLEQAFEILQPFLQEPLPQISHGICPNCRSQAQSR